MAALPLRWRLLSRPLLPPPAPPHAAFWRRLLVSQPTTNANAVRCSSSSSTSTPSEREGQEQQPPRPKRPRPFRLALVGRPNVGKSTLFNRLTGGGRGWVGGAAIVTDVPGTTRDRKEGRCSFGGLRMAVVDTGGLEEEDGEKDGQGAGEEEGDGTEGDGDDDEGPQQQWRQREAARAVRRRMQALINAQVEAAVKESDAVLLVLDARAGVGPEEEHLARWLLRMGAKDKTLVVANKAEGGVLSPAMQAAVYDAYAFGFPADPVPISAAHNEGISELAGAVVELAKARGFAAAASDEAREEDEDNEQEDALTVAFIGLPNVGKSSLLNALLHGPSPSAAAAAAIADGEAGRYPRLIASEVAGTTRDAVLVDYEWRGRQLRLVDTAGIRKKGRWDHRNKLERLAVEEALRAVRYANVVVLVLDGQQLRLRRQEQAVADTAFKEGRALVVAANKSDLLASSPKAFAQGVRDQLQLLSPQLGSLPVVPVSALTGQGVGGLLPAIARAYRAWNTRVSTGTLNRWLLEVQRFRSPPLTSRGRVVKLKYITQVKTRPPTFALVANTREVDDSYVRFLKNKLQEEFVLHGMDVRLSIKSTSDNNPFAQSSPRRDNQQHNQQQRRSSDRKRGKEEDEDEEEARQRRREREAARAQAARKRDEARGSKTYRTRTVGR